MSGEIAKRKSEKIDVLARQTAEMEEVMADCKTSAAIAVLQAKVQMDGEDPSNWDVAGWKNAISRLMGSEGEGSADEKIPEKVVEAKDIGATSKEV